VLQFTKIILVHEKNGFAERSKILAGYRSEKIILLNYQNNYLERSKPIAGIL